METIECPKCGHMQEYEDGDVEVNCDECQYIIIIQIED